ncbi:hypothetical protein J2Z21_002249 [Streptomyces griseochromogenes]|uniref:Uncharacterized protein n=1 Tax=Streptomyces griseochromogenes TaxID=68214 RepID=A0A1B1ARE9_9ACTN|nr:hypothetical protein [Streptomyces griseochromogenes]ANP49149.1 hypothetical protein AVL59_05720 [Streptomyces griseochromogenes]MBP2049318.1 hypothetical protein [Streptomyces griseochromogenes]
MESNGAVIRPTPQEARAALAELERVQASAAALSATPWPRWFAVVLTLYIAAIPPVFGGMTASPQWLLPKLAWTAIMVVATTGYSALFAVAAAGWREKTGVALRLDVLPKKVTLPLMIGLPALLAGSVLAFRGTGQSVWLFAASVVGAAVSVGFHLVFVRLHRQTS